MEVNRADSLRLSLQYAAGQTLIPTIEVAGHKAIVTPIQPLGTPGVPMQQAFGPDYAARAGAQLAGAAFAVQPVGEEYRPLAGEPLIWEWNLITDKADTQPVNLGVTIRWQQTASGETYEERQVWRHRLDILVGKPLISTGELSMLTLVSSLIGSGLSVPWLYKRLDNWRKERRKRKRRQPLQELPPPLPGLPGRGSKKA